MMDATKYTSDPIAIVQQLDARQIRERIDAIDRERDALMVLLRAAKRFARHDEVATLAERGGQRNA